jgi:hypothetical protein
MRPNTRFTKRLSALAAVLAGLWLALSLAAPCNAWHARAHSDGSANPSACALCLLLQSQVSAAETHVAAAAPPQFSEALLAASETRRIFVPFLLPPGRAPPAFS